MVLRLGKTQNLQKVLYKFLSFFWDFGHIWSILEIYRTFSEGSVNLLYFFQSTGEWVRYYFYAFYFSHYFWTAYQRNRGNILFCSLKCALHSVLLIFLSKIFLNLSYEKYNRTKNSLNILSTLCIFHKTS